MLRKFRWLALFLWFQSWPAQADRPPEGISRVPKVDQAKFSLDPHYRRLDSGGVFLLPRSCHLEIQYMLSTDGYTHYSYRSPVAWDWNHQPTSIKFAWKDTNPKTASVAWQVSLLKFNDSLNNWNQPPGLVASGQSARQGEFNTFAIDFGQFAPLPGKGLVPVQMAKPRLLPWPTPGGAVRRRPQAVQTAVKLDAPGQARSLAAGVRRMRLVTPMSFYVRVVPLDAQGNPLGFSAQPVEVVWGPQASGPPVQIQSPPPAQHPQIKITRYKPIQWSEAIPYHLLCLQDFPPDSPVFHKGQVYDFEPRPENLTPLEQIENFIKLSVDGWSICYKGIQDSITYVASYVFYKIDPTVGDVVREAEQAALIEGMAQLGLPAALPNYDQLLGMGEDYLVECLAQEAGVDPELAKEGVKLFKEMIKSLCEGGGNGAVLWIHAPDYCYRPAFLMLSVTNPSGQKTTPMDLVVQFGSYVPAWKDIGDMTGYYYPDGFKSQQVFADRVVHLPSIPPGGVLKMPVFLSETYDVNKETESLGDALAWSCWAWGYHRQQSLHLSTRLLNPSPNGPANVKDQDQASWVPDAGFDR